MRRPARKRESGLGYLVLGAVIACGTVALIVFGQLEASWPAFAALAAGVLLGLCLFRFGVRHAWLALLCLLGALAVGLVLFARTDVAGAAGIAWIGGFVAGTHLGVAWRIAAKNGKPVSAIAAWTVDGRGMSTVAEARKAAGAALHALNGTKGGRLSVERRDARFEVAGAVHPGFICHRTADAADEGSWAVLVRTGPVADHSVEIPMGGPKGFMPLRLVHDVVAVEEALAECFADPGSSSFGQDWETGNQAEGTRLTTR